MKAIRLTIVLVVISVYTSIGQINLFGVDITKMTEVKESLVYRKLDCQKNVYYTFAEYKSFPAKNMKFIMFDDFMAENETAQMRNPKEYTQQLSEEISKAFGQSFRVYENPNMVNPIENQYFWVTKEGDKFLVAKLFYSTFSQRNNLRVFIYDSERELAMGFENLTKKENQKEEMFYDFNMANVLHKF